MIGVTFNNVHSSTIDGLNYIKSNTFVIPESKDQYVEIPFMDSSYLIPDGTKKDIEIPVEFTLSATNMGELYVRFVQVRDWLHTEKRENLSFDDIPGVIFTGKVIGNVVLQHVDNFQGNVSEFTVTFRCSPDITQGGDGNG